MYVYCRAILVILLYIRMDIFAGVPARSSISCDITDHISGSLPHSMMRCFNTQSGCSSCCKSSSSTLSYCSWSITSGAHGHPAEHCANAASGCYFVLNFLRVCSSLLKDRHTKVTGVNSYWRVADWKFVTNCMQNRSKSL